MAPATATLDRNRPSFFIYDLPIWISWLGPCVQTSIIQVIGSHRPQGQWWVGILGTTPWKNASFATTWEVLSPEPWPPRWSPPSAFFDITQSVLGPGASHDVPGTVLSCTSLTSLWNRHGHFLSAVYMCIYIYMFTYLCMYLNLFMHLSNCIYMSIHIYLFLFIFIYFYLYLYAIYLLIYLFNYTCISNSIYTDIVKWCIMPTYMCCMWLYVLWWHKLMNDVGLYGAVCCVISRGSMWFYKVLSGLILCDHVTSWATMCMMGDYQVSMGDYVHVCVRVQKSRYLLVRA